MLIPEGITAFLNAAASSSPRLDGVSGPDQSSDRPEPSVEAPASGPLVVLPLRSRVWDLFCRRPFLIGASNCITGATADSRFPVKWGLSCPSVASSLPDSGAAPAVVAKTSEGSAPAPREPLKKSPPAQDANAFNLDLICLI